MKQKQVVSTLVSKYFDGRRPGHAIKTNSIKFETVDPGIYSKHDFFFLKKGLVSLLNVVHDFSRKFPCLIAFLKIFDNMCIIIVCYPVSGVINFEIYLKFLIEPFSYLTKRPEQKFEYLKN